MNHQKMVATILAILAALFYALNMPFSKGLLASVPPTFMAAFLYLGAGTGIGLLYLLGRGKQAQSAPLTKEDFPYTLAMIVLDIIAPICLMYGLRSATAANASLLNNFEIVATSLVAMVVFQEVLSARLWLALALITAATMLLSFEDAASLTFSWGSLFVLLAAVCWGFENNCTRKISSKNTYEIVMLKGIFSGLGSLIIAFGIGESLPMLQDVLAALLLGFVAYGLSIFCYIRAQNQLGAAKTSAYYAIAPFVGAFLSFVMLQEPLSAHYPIALLMMLVGSAVVVLDTIKTEQS